MENRVDSGWMVAHANYAALAPSERIGPMTVDSRMLLWCRAGRGSVAVNGGIRELGAGDFLLLPWRHRIEYRAGAGENWELGGIHLVYGAAAAEDPKLFWVCHAADCPGARNPLHDDGGWPYGAREVVAGQLRRVPHWEALFEYAVNWYQLPERDAGSARHLAALVMRGLELWFAAGPEMPLPLHFQRLLERCRRRLREPLPVEVMCRLGGCARATLFRQFREYLGETPNRWLTRERLAAAAVQLSRTALSAAEIADAVGIGDANYLAKLFRRHYGVTPTAYRRSHGLPGR